MCLARRFFHISEQHPKPVRVVNHSGGTAGRVAVFSRVRLGTAPEPAESVQFPVLDVHVRRRARGRRQRWRLLLRRQYAAAARRSDSRAVLYSSSGRGKCDARSPGLHEPGRRRRWQPATAARSRAAHPRRLPDNGDDAFAAGPPPRQLRHVRGRARRRMSRRQVYA